ncbi:MAG: serine/threonine-protein kinase [Mycobacteriales bacterium]
MTAHDVGTLIAGRYRLERLAGRGGMADVYEASDLLLDRPVAVKLMRAGVPRWDTEARVLAGLDHPGLVGVHDAGDGDPPYLVLQMVPGRTLGERLHDGGPMAPAAVAELGRQLAGTLAYVHAHGVVHRDVKPANVLVGDGDGRPRLVDFGICQDGDATTAAAAGEVVGSAPYLAPELLRGEPAGDACDVYALGLVLLECLTGHPEYEGTAAEAALARLTRPPRVPPGTPEPLRSVLTGMLADDPADRCTAADVAARLGDRPAEPAEAAAAVGAGAGASAADPGPATEAIALPPQPRARAGRALATAAALVVAGTLSLLTTAADRHAPPASPRTGVDAPAQNGVGGTAGTNRPAAGTNRTAVTVRPGPATHAKPPPAGDHGKDKGDKAGDKAKEKKGRGAG